MAWEVVEGKSRYDGRTLAEWVPEIVADIVRAFAPLQVILFGSVARGDDGPDSDIDLLVVLPHIEPAERMQRVVEISRAIDAPAPKDVFVTDPDEIARRRDLAGSFHYWPLREGKVVYEHPGAKARLAVNGTPDDPLVDARARLGRAEEDLGAARSLASSGGPPRLVSFLAHLAVEKALKALLVGVERSFPKLHDLTELVERLPAGLGRRFDHDDLTALNPWVIEGRYGEDVADPTAEEAERLLARAETVLRTVREQLDEVQR